MTPIELRFHYEEAEYTEAMRFFLDRTLPLRRNLVLGVLGVLGGAWFWNQSGFSWLWGLLIGVSIAMLLLVALSLYWLPKQAYKRDPNVREQQTMRFAEDGVAVSPPVPPATFGWDVCHRVVENEKFYVLVTGRSMLAAVPKRAFASEAQRAEFDALLVRKALKKA